MTGFEPVWDGFGDRCISIHAPHLWILRRCQRDLNPHALTDHGFQDRCNTVLHHNSKIIVFLVSIYEKKWVAGDGFEPPTFGLWPRRATRLLLPCYSWQGGTRTHDKPINSRSLYLLSYMSRICVVNEIYYNSKTSLCPLFFYLINEHFFTRHLLHSCFYNLDFVCCKIVAKSFVCFDFGFWNCGCSFGLWLWV